jgi:RND family efflux transporter MFP subunit
VTRARWLLVAAVIALLIALVAVIGLSIGKKLRVDREGHRRDEVVQAGPRVTVVEARPAPPTTVLVLQGEVRPYLQTTLYAKIPGFLRDISVDKGDRVRAGEVLGRIESPETDRQVAGARANALSQIDIARRQQVLASRQLVAIQDAEVATANARVAKEQLRQLQATRDYELLRAPFDGVVVQRLADPGAYLGSFGQSMPVVTVALTGRLRVYAYVDERHAERVRVGDVARVRFPSESKPREAKVIRIAGALDPRTRMLLVEAQLENPGQLVPGGWAEVSLTVKQPPGVVLPADALSARGETIRVAVIDAQNRVRRRPVELLDTDGKTALVRSGVEPGDRVAIGAGESIADGARVQPVAPKPAPGSERRQ